MTRDLTVYEGAVYHRRLKPENHAFRYKVFSFFADIDALDDIARDRRFFSRNKFNLFSFYDKDHGLGDGEDVAAYLRNELQKAGLPSAARISALFYPRILGYAFNPLVVFYCYDEAGDVFATFYQVNNTFGERHTYLIPTGGIQTVNKIFHVSPFIDMTMRYEFRAPPPTQKISLAIDVSDADGLLLKTSFTGDASTSAHRSLLRLLAAHPLMIAKVIVGIHFEALRLLMKGLRLRPGAPTPPSPISLGAVSASK